MATKPAKPETETEPEAQAEAPAPQAGFAIFLPTPTQHENDSLAATQAAGEPLPELPWYHAMDGSPIEESYDPTPITTPTWP